MSSISAKNNVKCEEWDVTTSTQESMKIHVDKVHKGTSEHCNENYAGNRKLTNHMCRVHEKIGS